MKITTLILVLLFACFSVFAQNNPKPEDTEVWEPEPLIVTPGTSSTAPSDAIVLFDGTNMNSWVSTNGSPVEWKIENGILEVVPGTGDITTKEKFGSCQVHIEFNTPDTGKDGQLGGNSGIFFQNRYEVQILNSYENRTYSNGQAASIYKQNAPLVNASLPRGEWQTYDIIFTAPTWNDNGSRKTAGYFTVIHNGVLVQNHVEIQGTTEYIGPPLHIKHDDDCFKLQDHGDKMKFRNIWVRKL